MLLFPPPAVPGSPEGPESAGAVVSWWQKCQQWWGGWMVGYFGGVGSRWWRWRRQRAASVSRRNVCAAPGCGACGDEVVLPSITKRRQYLRATQCRPCLGAIGMCMHARVESTPPYIIPYLADCRFFSRRRLRFSSASSSFDLDPPDALSPLPPPPPPFPPPPPPPSAQ